MRIFLFCFTLMLAVCNCLEYSYAEQDFPSDPFDQIIFLYKKLISSQNGPQCVFSPSCSQYTQQAVSDYGPIMGILMGTDRLIRCHPGAYKYHNLGDHGLIDLPLDHILFEDDPGDKR